MEVGGATRGGRFNGYRCAVTMMMDSDVDAPYP